MQVFLLYILPNIVIQVQKGRVGIVLSNVSSPWCHCGYLFIVIQISYSYLTPIESEGPQNQNQKIKN